MRMIFRAALLAVAAVLVLPGVATAAVKAGQLFPTNLLTVPDSTQVTGLRVNLPKPDCAARPSDCADVEVLNQLDGFNIQPRISIPLSGAINLSTISKATVFLVAQDEHVIGPNQLVWEPAANTLYVESDEQLDQSTTYLLVVTRGVHGTDGEPLDATTFRHDLNYGQTKDPAVKAYRKALLKALPLAKAGGADPSDIAAASLFTTQSITPISQKIRSQLQGGDANFVLGTGGQRTVFPFSSVASVTWQRQVRTAPPNQFTTGGLFLPLLAGVGTIAFGSYSSPDYETPAKIIPAVGTATGTPVPQGTHSVQFSLFVPAGARPAGGWPVAIFGHGFTDWKNGAPPVVAGRLALNGIASIAINVVGHGGGPLGTYTVGRTGGQPPVTLPLGGRGIDQNGDGAIDSTEGVNAAPPFTLIGNRDGLRQTTIDLMQLVKVLEGGVDVDGDGTHDLSASRLYYAGQSFGGIYGTQLMGLEPDLHAGVLNVPGGPIIEIARLSPSFRILVGLSLLSRTPSLYNAVPDPGFMNFHENIPLRGKPPVTATPDETAIQQLVDRSEWAQQAGNPAAYAPHVTAPVIYQFARGDKTVPNPTTSAILRACGCADRATLYRNDLAFLLNPAVGTNPHTFLTNVGNPAGASFAFAAQQQIATFFATDGAVTVDPDGAGSIFETPTSMVPEDLAFIP
ncbi:MAG TPA: Ig-like domain-containing protein [Gaiellaceae bacterium]|nr:Ig-like domain-containing protein [Gaiellaceae bacterium]